MSDWMRELRELDALRKDGLINDQEYELQRELIVPKVSSSNQSIQEEEIKASDINDVDESLGLILTDRSRSIGIFMLVCFSVLGILTNVMPLVGTKNVSWYSFRNRKVSFSDFDYVSANQWEFYILIPLLLSIWLWIAQTRRQQIMLLSFSFPVFLQNIVSLEDALHLLSKGSKSMQGLLGAKYVVPHPTRLIFWGFGFYGYLILGFLSLAFVVFIFSKLIKASLIRASHRNPHETGSKVLILSGFLFALGFLYPIGKPPRNFGPYTELFSSGWEVWLQSLLVVVAIFATIVVIIHVSNPVARKWLALGLITAMALRLLNAIIQIYEAKDLLIWSFGGTITVISICIAAIPLWANKRI